MISKSLEEKISTQNPVSPKKGEKRKTGEKKKEK